MKVGGRRSWHWGREGRKGCECCGRLRRVGRGERWGEGEAGQGEWRVEWKRLWTEWTLAGVGVGDRVKSEEGEFVWREQFRVRGEGGCEGQEG